MNEDAVWARARSVLAVRLDNLGDVLMTTPALRAIRAGARPGAVRPRVTLLTSRGASRLAGHVPEIDEMVAFDAPWVAAGARGAGDDVSTCIEQLRARRFDAAVIFTVYSQSLLPAATMLHQAGVPAVLGRCRENPYGLLTDWVREDEPETTIRHEVRRQLDLVATVGFRTGDERLSFRYGTRDHEAAADTLGACGIGDDQPYAVLHPGASAESRRYPPAQFGEVAKLLARSGMPVVITGSRQETMLAETVRSVAGTAGRSLAGRLSLGSLGAVIDGARVLVSNNSGPVHMAAALGTPVVDLYALTNPQHTPWQVASRVLYEPVSCGFCYSSRCLTGHHRCLRGVTPARIVAAVEELVGRPKRAVRDAAG